ncbi:MAG: zraR 7 [Chloroflexi bacterium]|nr:zraR 7 [Chloroflexota bacterium]
MAPAWTEAHQLGRVLVVDDEVELMSALCETLAGHGYDVVGRSSGREALEVLKEQDVDLLLSDLMMPGMDGVRLLPWRR